MNEHYAQEAEKAVLGSILEDNSVLPQVLDRIAPDDLYFDVHKHILRAMIELQDAGKPVEPVLLADVLNRTGRLESFGGPHVFIADIMDTTPSAALAAQHCKLIKEKAVIRNIIVAAQRIIQKAEDAAAGDVGDLIAFAQKEIMATVPTGTPSGTDLRQLVKEVFDCIEERYKKGGALPGIVSGFKSIDALLGSFKTGCFYVVAGRPGTGKTAIALNIARFAAGNGESGVILFT